MQADEFDVVISGGGLSGLLTAIGILAETNELSIAVIEPQVADNSHQVTSNFDDRCLALSYGSLQLLNHWGIWQELKALSWPIETIVTSDRGHLGKTIMRAEDYQLNAMGYVASMKSMAKAFQARLKTLNSNNQITFFNGQQISELIQTKNEISLKLDNNVEITAKLLVVAEGANSSTRQALKIPTSLERYDQHAIIANVQVKENKQHKNLLARNKTDKNKAIAFERFTTNGPIAFLPIGNDTYSVVWSVAPEQVNDIMGLSEDEFNKQLQKAFGTAAGSIIKSQLRASYPLVLTKPDYIHSGRCVLLGNAAHAVHPIAGQGFNLGIRDIAVLVSHIAKSSQQQIDLGDFDSLNSFAKARRKDIDRITTFTDLLVRSFGLKGRIPALARTAGLLSLQKCDSLTQWLALHFMSSKKTPQ